MSLSYDFVGRTRKRHPNIPWTYDFSRHDRVFGDSRDGLIGEADDVLTTHSSICT